MKRAPTDLVESPGELEQGFSIEFIGIGKTYPAAGESIHALRHLDLEVAAGERVAILGRSGCGKSTLLHLLGGLDTPTAGELLLARQPMHRLNGHQRAQLRLKKIGFIHQSFHLLSHLSALQNVELPLKLAGLAKTVRRERALELLRELGLEDRLHHRPAELSGGQQQRVAIARAVAPRPCLLLADEPTGNLDTRTADQIIELLREYCQSTGTTAFLVTHDREIAQRFASRIISMEDGEITSSESAGHRE